jgi:hypothetical protein
MEDEFGKGYARSVASDQVISALDQRTPVQALDAGVPPRQVWTAVCEAMNVPPERRLGLDPGERRKRGTQRGDR